MEQEMAFYQIIKTKRVAFDELNEPIGSQEKRRIQTVTFRISSCWEKYINIANAEIFHWASATEVEHSLVTEILPPPLKAKTKEKVKHAKNHVSTSNQCQNH